MTYRLLLRIGRKKRIFIDRFFLRPVEDKIGFMIQKSVQNPQHRQFL